MTTTRLAQDNPENTSTQTCMQYGTLSRNGALSVTLHTSCSFRGHCTAEAAASLTLHKGCLILKDGQSFLQSLDFRLTPCLAGRICLRLSNAAILELPIILQNC